MKFAAFALCLAIAGCASATIDTSWPDPRGADRPTQTASNGGSDPIRVDIPDSGSYREDAYAAAARCAQYGRAASGTGENTTCVPRSEYAGRDREPGGQFHD